MAQRVQIQLLDDINGQEAQETLRFAFDGTEYEIDLTTENAAQFRSAFSEYAQKARKATSGRGGRAAQRGTLNTKRDEVQKIRQWAQDNGYTPSSRGRISQSIVDAYNEAMK